MIYGFNESQLPKIRQLLRDGEGEDVGYPKGSNGGRFVTFVSITGAKNQRPLPM